jgi:hypothetical protein
MAQDAALKPVQNRQDFLAGDHMVSEHDWLCPAVLLQEQKPSKILRLGILAILCASNQK